MTNSPFFLEIFLITEKNNNAIRMALSFDLIDPHLTTFKGHLVIQIKYYKKALGSTEASLGGWGVAFIPGTIPDLQSDQLVFKRDKLSDYVDVYRGTEVGVEVSDGIGGED